MFNNLAKRQSGNVLMVAIFVILVLGLLAANLARISWSNQDTLAREYLGTQAWFLAHSGNEWAMTQLFPLDGAEDYNSIETRCTGLDSIAAAQAMVDNNDLPCVAPTIQCITPATGVPDELKYFKVVTRATCSEGSKFEVERVQEAWLKGQIDG